MGKINGKVTVELAPNQYQFFVKQGEEERPDLRGDRAAQYYLHKIAVEHWVEQDHESFPNR